MLARTFLGVVSLFMIEGSTTSAQTLGAFPNKVEYQARIFTPAGLPFATPAGLATPVTIRIYANPSGGTVLHTTVLSEKIEDGYSLATMNDQGDAGSTQTLSEAFNGNNDLYVEIEVDGLKLEPRMKLSAVPYAFRSHFSDSAATADDVPQKVISPASITINGQTVIDSTAKVNGSSLAVNGTTLFNSLGQWVGPSELVGWQVVGQDVKASLTVRCAQTCSMQHCEIRQINGNPAIHFHTDNGPTQNYAARLFYQETTSPSFPNTKVPHVRLEQGAILSSAFLELRGTNRPGIDFTSGAAQVSAPFDGDDGFDMRLQWRDDDNLDLLSSNLTLPNGSVTATGFTTSSDARLKKNVQPIGSALQSILALNGITYEWIDADREASSPPRLASRRIGFLAQEVGAVLPEVVSTNSDGYLAVDYPQIVPELVEAIKELKHIHDAELATRDAELSKQAKRISELEGMLAKLATRLETLEKQEGR